MTASSSIGTRIALRITAALAGFIAAVCGWFEVTPHSLKQPGVRPNAPPPGGGFSSLG